MKAPIQFGKYYLLERIAVGGMAEVYRSKTFGLEGSERIVALKRILPLVAADKELVSMFIDEAKLAIQLNHPNICKVFDWGKVEDSYYLAMEYVSGCDLRTVFQRCKQLMEGGVATMPTAQSCFIVMKLCEGLEYAHSKKDPLGNDLGLVHRDISPANVMLSYEGEVKLIDFGIAKVQVDRQAQTEAGVLKGKFAYMSPEQVRGEKLDRRSDIFSAGIVLYELLTGERLFPVDSDLSSLEKIRNVEILPPSTYNRRISEELERIIMKALSREAEERYQTAMDLHADLQQFMYTSGEFYSRKELLAWMKRVFRTELEAEQVQLDAAREFRPANVPTTSASEPLARARATMSMAALRMPGEATGALRVPKEPTGALRIPKEGEGAAAPSSWTPGRAKPKRPGSTPPPPPRQAVQSIAEAASSMAQSASNKAAKPVVVKGAPKIEGKPLPSQQEEDTAVDGPAGIKPVESRFTDDSLSTRPFEPQDRALIESAARDGKAGKGAQNRDIDEGPTRAFTPQRPDELGEEQAAAGATDPGDLETNVFTPVAEDLRELAAAAVPGKSGNLPAIELEPLRNPAPLAAPPPSRSTPAPAAPAPPRPLSGPAQVAPPPPINPPRPPSNEHATHQARSAPPMVMPPPELSIPANTEVPPTPQKRSSSRAGLWLFIVALLLLGIGGGAYWLFGRSGELIVVAEPGRELIVSVDQKPVAVTDSPVRLRLQPGHHMVSVQHNGLTPWSEDLSLNAGETVVRNIRLEAIVHKTGSFTLISDPPKAEVTLDGSPLGQATPIRVQSVIAGPHNLELRLGSRMLRQSIIVEADKSIEVKVTLPAEPTVVAPTGDNPTVTPLDTKPTVATPEHPSATGPGEKPTVAVAPEKPPTEVKPPKEVKPPTEKPNGKLGQNTPKGPGRPGRPKKRGGTTGDTPLGAQAAGNNGYLRINSRPWTKIIVDGIDSGLNTPQLSYRISAGTHQVTLYNPQFSIKETFTITVQPGESQTITKIFNR